MASIPGVRFNITGASGSQGFLSPKNAWRAYVFPRGGYAAQDSTGTLITFDSAAVASRFAALNWIQVGLSTANIRQVAAVGGNSISVSGAALTVAQNDRVFLVGNTQPTVSGGSATYTTPASVVYQRDDDASSLYANSMITSNSDGLVQFFANANYYDVLVQDGNQTNQAFSADLPIGSIEGISTSSASVFGATVTISANLIPGTDATYYVGTSSPQRRWLDGYFSGTLVTPRLGPASSAASGGARRLVDGVSFALNGAGIQAAINDLPTGGGTVLLPAVTFGVTTQITVPSGVRLQGSGWGTVLQRTSGFDFVNGLLYLNGSAADVTDVTISNLRIDINGTVGLLTTSNGLCIDMRAAGANQIRRCRVENCWLQNGWVGGIALVNGTDCFIDNNYFTNCGNHTTVGSVGLLFQPATNCHARGNVLINTNSVAALVTTNYVISVESTSTRCIVAENVIQNSVTTGQGKGIAVRGTATLCIVRGNVVDGQAIAGIDIEGVAVTSVTDTIVANNIVVNAGRAGTSDPCIKESATRTVILGNVTGSTSANNGVESAGNETSIFGNVCSNNTSTTIGTGIYMAGGRKVVVGNVCNGNGLSGIAAENLGYSIIALNTMLNNGGAGAGDGLKLSSATGGVSYTVIAGNNIGETRAGGARTQRLGLNNSLGAQPASGTQAFGNLSENNITSDFADLPSTEGALDWLNVTGVTPSGAGSGSFTCAAAASTIINNKRVRAASRIFVWPTNAAAATLESGTKKLYTSGKTAGSSFSVTTQDASAAAGTETFDFIILP